MKYLKPVDNFSKVGNISTDSLLMLIDNTAFCSVQKQCSEQSLEIINSCRLVISCLRTLSELRQDVVKTGK